MDYFELQKDADDLLAEFGTLVTFKKHTNGTYDPATGTTTGASDTSFVVRAALVPFDDSYIDGNKYEWDEEYRSGTSIRLLECRCLMSAISVSGQSIDAVTGDTVVIDSKIWTIKESKPLRPSGTTVFYDLTLRG